MAPRHSGRDRATTSARAAAARRRGGSRRTGDPSPPPARATASGRGRRGPADGRAEVPLRRSGVRPTTRAEELAAMITPALDMLRAGLGTARDFDPATVKREVNIGTSDYVALTLMPQLIARLRELAPGFDLRLRPTSRQAAVGD